MRRTFALINQNCRLATRLVSESHERELTRLERAGLGIHLCGCRSCRRYKQQVEMIDQLVVQAKSEANDEAHLTEEARTRLRLALTA